MLKSLKALLDFCLLLLPKRNDLGELLGGGDPVLHLPFPVVPLFGGNVCPWPAVAIAVYCRSPRFTATGSSPYRARALFRTLRIESSVIHAAELRQHGVVTVARRKPGQGIDFNEIECSVFREAKVDAGKISAFKRVEDSGRRLFHLFAKIGRKVGRAAVFNILLVILFSPGSCKSDSLEFH